MDWKPPIYVHSLLFRCGQCKGPLFIAVTSTECNLEGIDADSFDVECKCGWLKTLLGLEAVSHHVTLWEDTQNVEHPKE
jgi:hypothetical protein